MFLTFREVVLTEFLDLEFGTFFDSKGDFTDISKVSNEECLFLTIS